MQVSPLFKKMIGKNKLKLIRSLARKKFRQKENLFLTEGDKNVAEVLNSRYIVRELFATEEFISNHEKIAQKAKKITEVEPGEIKKASLLQTPQNCIAICEIPDRDEQKKQINGLTFYLDGIQDPGNLGTIIRTCDWFGIETIFCSADTADLYNPKVIQASMGSFCRVHLLETTPDEIASLTRDSDIPVFGTFMNGKNVYTETLPESALVVLGNEGNGIRDEAERIVQQKISIPAFSKSGAESLNVGVAAGIICSEFKRRLL